jgi:hypothetical protein
MATWKRGEVERRARLGTNFVELLQSGTGGRSRRVLRDLDALIFVLSDSVTSVRQLEEGLGAMFGCDEVARAIERVAGAGAVLRAGEHVVATVAFAERHADADLRAWAERNGWSAQTEPAPGQAVMPHHRPEPVVADVGGHTAGA